MNTEQQRALLPCPFCGGKPSMSKQMGESLWSHDIVLWTQVQCDECEAHVGPTCEGFEVEAVDIWNRRADLQSQDRDATMEAVRKQLCAVPRYSFITRKGGVSRVHDRTGNWIEFDQAHALFDPVNVDHARRVEGDKDA